MKKLFSAFGSSSASIAPLIADQAKKQLTVELVSIQNALIDTCHNGSLLGSR